MDHRVRIRPLPGQENTIYGGRNSAGFNPMQPLVETGGMIFPYTPTVQISQNVEYGKTDVVHSIGNYPYFVKNENFTVSINGVFTAQNGKEAKYLLAALHFLSANSKMRFGSSDPNRGLPPPTLLLSGYGSMIFPDIPVVIDTYTTEYPSDVDLVEVRYGNVSAAFVPAKTTISVTLIARKKPIDYLRNFNLDQFRSGELLIRNSGFR